MAKRGRPVKMKINYLELSRTVNGWTVKDYSREWSFESKVNMLVFLAALLD